MDARTAESPVISQQRSWLQRERASGRFYDRVSALLGLFLVAMIGTSVWLLRRGAEPGSLLSPPLIALLLVAILLPAIALMALYARKLALGRAEQGGLGSGRLHIRLVVLFTAIAAVPTVLVAIFASLLFQSGLEFWFSNRARSMIENTSALAQSVYAREADQVANETLTMSTDVSGYLKQIPIDDPRFADAFARGQVYNRGLSEAIIFTTGPKGELLTQALVNPYDRPLDKLITRDKIAQVNKQRVVAVNSPDRLGALTKLEFGANAYIYGARVFDPRFRDQMERADDVLADYQALLDRSRLNQLRFNAALLLGALIIVALSILTALRIADRLVRPVGELVGAAGRIEEGDFSARVAVTESQDEV